MHKSFGKTSAQVATIATGVAAVWYLLHQVMRVIYFTTTRNIERNYDTEAYLGITD